MVGLGERDWKLSFFIGSLVAEKINGPFFSLSLFPLFFLIWVDFLFSFLSSERGLVLVGMGISCQQWSVVCPEPSHNWGFGFRNLVTFECHPFTEANTVLFWCMAVQAREEEGKSLGRKGRYSIMPWSSLPWSHCVVTSSGVCVPFHWLYLLLLQWLELRRCEDTHIENNFRLFSGTICIQE